MKIERFKYGMFDDGKVWMPKTDGLNAILSDKNFQRLRELKVEDNEKYLWLPTEQLVAFPRISIVSDEDGRTFVRNETLLIGIHDYLRLSDPKRLLSPYFSSEWKSVPEKLEPIVI